MKPSKGFTLAEMVIVVAVVGTLTAIALPRVQFIRAQTAVRSAASQLVASHGTARTTAMRFGRVSRLRIDASQGRFWVEVDTTLASTGTYTRMGPLKDVSTDHVDMTSTGNVVCFDARGIASRKGACPGGALTVVFSRDGVVDTVRATSLGKVIDR